MKLTIHILLIICLFDSQAAYSSTRMTSQRNAEVPQRHYEKILVHGDFQNFEYRRTAEEKLCHKLKERTDIGECVKYVDVFFPGENYSDQQIVTKLSEQHIDAILTLRQTGSGTSSSYIPETTYTTMSASVIGNQVRGSSTTNTYGGYSIIKPTGDYEVILFSIKDGKVAWFATASSKGSVFSSPNSLARGVSNKAIDKIIDDGVLNKRATQ